jgi:toxin ParE1/3/4
VNPHQYVLLPSANDDPVESAAYLIGNASEGIAAKFVISVFSTSSLLASMPRIGMQCHFTKTEFRSVRRFPPNHFRRWLIFYRPSEAGIEVVRVIHSARDWSRLFV